MFPGRSRFPWLPIGQTQIKAQKWSRSRHHCEENRCRVVLHASTVVGSQSLFGLESFFFFFFFKSLFLLRFCPYIRLTTLTEAFILWPPMAISKNTTVALPIQSLMNNTSSDYSGSIHPYYPLDAEIAGYVANESTVLGLLGSFVAGCTAIFALTYLAVKKVNPRLPRSELLTVMWFVLCKCWILELCGGFLAN